MSIPNHMKINKSRYSVRPELVDCILDKCIPLLQKSKLSCVGDYCEVDGLFVSVKWRKLPFAKRLRLFDCITVSRCHRSLLHHEYYRLVQYSDFTRVYNPGDWEGVFNAESA